MTGIYRTSSFGPAIPPRIVSGGFALFANGTGIVSFDRVRWSQYPDPSLSLAPIIPRVGTTLVSWNALVLANTTSGKDISLDGVNWTDVSSQNGGSLPGIYSQPDPTSDGFGANSGANYTNTFRPGGSAGTWTYDTANSRLVATGGTNALYLYNAINRADVDLFADLDQSDAGGLVWRCTAAGSFYYLLIADDHASTGTKNTVTLYKVGYPSVILSDAPLAYYRVDEASGPNATDSSGNGNTGTYVGSGVTYSQTGTTTVDTNTAVSFDGITGKMTLPSSVNPASALSYECWFKIASYPGSSNSIMGNYNFGGAGFIGAGLGLNTDGTVTWNVCNNSGAFITITSSPISTGAFHHIVGVFDGSNSKFYLDGSLVGSTATTFAVGSDAIQVGSSPFNDFGAAVIDEVAVYGSALPLSRVQAHFNAATTPTTTQLGAATISYTVGPANNPTTVTFTRGTYRRFRVSMLAGVITVYCDGIQLLTYTDTTPLPAGLMGLYNNGGTTGSRYYQLWMQPQGDVVTGTPPGDVVSGKFVYTRARLATTDPTVTPQVEDLTTMAATPQIGAGVSIPSVAYNATFISKNFDDLAKQSNYYWFIDQNKYFNFKLLTAQPAPWILQSAPAGLVQNVDLEVTGNLELDVANDLYRNRQIILGAQDTLTASATFIGDGSTRSFTLGYPPASAPTILLNDIAQSVGLKGATGFNWYYAVGDPTLEQDTSGTILQASDQLSVPDYSGLFDVTVIVDNAAAQAAQKAVEVNTSGIVEAVEDHSSDNPRMSKDAAITLATQLIARYAIAGRTLIFDTTRNGLAIGQTLSIFLPEHGVVDGQFLITEIEVTLQKGINDTQVWWYKVAASELPKQASWARIIAAGLGLQ